MGFNNYGKTQNTRIENTLSFLSKHTTKRDIILDLGIENPLSSEMIKSGYKVDNTGKGIDLDLDFEIVKGDYDIVTSFEIFEHMVSPFPLLQSIRAPKLITSVPLKLWFTDAYWNEKDPFDRHYHEFEPKQFDMLLDKAGWKIIDQEKWTSRINHIGIRPLLRRFTPRYYIVYCERK
ncbi:MAG: methyltransferase [Bacteroidales bacterium]|nr:methyltransferase [Bacteroidales bacterium]